ncbi:MAG TPA: hypothetical protein VFC63_02390 [Blastocatellia bacterium]|nr:hypothetical protein [Blastocatellia bacterium]
MLIWFARIRRFAAFAVIPATINAVFAFDEFARNSPSEEGMTRWVSMSLMAAGTLIILSIPKWQSLLSLLGVWLIITMCIH